MAQVGFGHIAEQGKTDQSSGIFFRERKIFLLVSLGDACGGGVKRNVVEYSSHALLPQVVEECVSLIERTGYQEIAVSVVLRVIRNKGTGKKPIIFKNFERIMIGVPDVHAALHDLIKALELREKEGGKNVRGKE